MPAEVSYAADALADIAAIHHTIASDAGPERAANYIRRVFAACEALAIFPRRGSPRDDLVPGLRTTSFQRRVLICYFVDGDSVKIARMLYGGRDPAGAFCA